MSENERTPGRLDLSRICKMPTGKAGKAAKKQFEKERKARIEKIRQLTYASGGDGLLVMLTAADRKVCRYIMKKLDHVIPFFVRACADGRCPSVTQEMGWLLDSCSKQGFRTMWLDLAGTEKLDKKQILYLVAGELIRVLERPAPERISMEEAAEPEAVPVEAVEEAAEPEAVPVEEAEEAAEPEDVPVEAVEEAAEPEAVPVEAVEEPETVPVEAVEETAEPETVPVEAVEEAAEPEAVPVAEVAEPEKMEEPEKPVDPEKPAPARRRTRKAAAKTEEAAPAKPRRKRQARAPLTVEETLAKRRRQLGLEE